MTQPHFNNFDTHFQIKRFNLLVLIHTCIGKSYRESMCVEAELICQK